MATTSPSPRRRRRSKRWRSTRPIVHFLARRALWLYLKEQTALPDDRLSLVFADLSSIPSAPPLSGPSALTVLEADQIEHALDRVHVLDPAVGSGAFLVGTLHELVGLRRACYRARGVEVPRGSSLVAKWKRDVIAHSLYGVDIKPEAVEIARLRLWLSLVVDLDRDQVEPLPNLDYKLMVGDSLLETVDGEPILPEFAPGGEGFPVAPVQGALPGVPAAPVQLGLGMGAADQARADLVELKERYFAAEEKGERDRLRVQIEAQERAVVLAAVEEKLADVEARVKRLVAKGSQVNWQAALDAADLARHGRTTPSGEGRDRVAHLRQRQALLEELNALWEQMIHDSGDDPEVTDYVELRRGDRPDWEDLAHLATDLRSDTALLSLFTTGDRTLLFVLRAGMDAPEVVEAPLDGTAWQVMLRRFLREVHFHDGSGRRGETWLRPLLPLLEAAAPHLPEARRVVFAPESGGHLLPWGLLARRAGWEAPVVTVPALGLLVRVLRRPAGDRSGALVVGNPTRDLPYASEEALRVAGILGTRPLVGRKATRQAVLSRLGKVGLAHFATHAYFAAGSSLDSGIVLADGVLTAREILERGLRAPEFLALSACRTGMAESLGGDEMAGLSQALLYAGARSLLVSLWTVNDLATAHLVTGFYRRWRKEGQDKATALRDAMEATRQARPEWAHTYYWGAFTLVGDWR